ncbi:MAG: PilZ domain-containing protein [Desulfocapsaceae bacterium]|nr:PilZ domain-containing protein [Desulfocapsaceae bacterium]
MAGNQRSKVTADLKRNRLNITLSSSADKREVEKVYTDIRFCVADLKPGFAVITDLSQCTIASLNAILTMRQIMEYLVAKQAGNIVRVVGKKNLVFKQLLRFTNRFQGYKPVYVSTLEEAEEILTNVGKRQGLRFDMHRQQVEYTLDQEKEKGHLVDISISGCAVQGSTKSLSADKEISIAIPFQRDNETPLIFTTAAKVVWVRGDQFAAQFLDLDDDRKAELYTCLASEAQRDIPQE